MISKPISPKSTSHEDSSEDVERTMSYVEVDVTLDPHGPIINGQDPLDIQPLSRLFLELQEVEIPDWLKDHKLYKIGDWKAFIKARPDGRHNWVSD
uniref:Uncharacterized protein n=1 Tax=Arundo donax TaxID=35708 RepID=A0A0A8Y8E0_ARUDO